VIIRFKWSPYAIDAWGHRHRHGHGHGCNIFLHHLPSTTTPSYHLDLACQSSQRRRSVTAIQGHRPYAMGSHSPEAWFETLSTHPIFTSSPASSSSQPTTTTTTTTTTSNSGRKNTFGISSLDNPSSNTSDEDDEDEETEMIYDKHGDEVMQRKDRVVVRGGKELIAVVGREIRLVDLKEVKEGKPARYWVCLPGHDSPFLTNARRHAHPSTCPSVHQCLVFVVVSDRSWGTPISTFRSTRSPSTRPTSSWSS
jgi:hypothetical protein